MGLAFDGAESLGQRKRTRRDVFLDGVEHVVAWEVLLSLIEPHYPVAGCCGRQSYPLAAMLHVHLLQQWYASGDPALEEVLHDTSMMRRFTGLGGLDAVPENVMIITAPSSTRNTEEKPDSQMHQIRAWNRRNLGMKAHIGVDEVSDLVHHATCTVANPGDMTMTHALQHGQEDTVLDESGYTGADRRPELENCGAALVIAAKRSKMRTIRSARDHTWAQGRETCKASLYGQD